MAICVASDRIINPETASADLRGITNPASFPAEEIVRIRLLEIPLTLPGVQAVVI